MSLRATPLCLWVVIGFVVVVTAVHGYWTDRWNPVSQEESLGELVAVPRQIGEWTGVDVDVPQPTEKEAATLVRRYTHASTEERSVLMVLTRGLPGIASVHTPDLCYPGGGYHLVTSIDRKFLTTPDGTQGEFYTAVFQKSKLGEVQRININWGWTTNGHWEAPDYPRWKFAGGRRLYKLYIVLPVGESETDLDELSLAFTGELLGAINQTFFPPDAPRD